MMKKQIETIIQNYTKTYGFYPVAEYVKMHKKNATPGFFDNYAFFDGYQTIITLLFPYPRQETTYLGKGYGLLARFSYGIDYHKVILTKLETIIKQLNALGIKGYGSVDVSRLDEKYVAYLSGLGYFGKHSILIHPEYGSYMFIGTILIDKDIHNQSTILENECGDCRKCIDACPSNALDHGFNRELCISHLSQTKMEFDENQVSYFKKTIYGCDICLKACPKNHGIDVHQFPEFEPNGIENVDLEKMLLMTKKEFQDIFGNNTSHWIGVGTMRRNALCLIGNQNLVDFIPKIKKSMSVYKDNLWYNKTADIVLKRLERE